ncbi:protein takeout-like isoform X2 [Zophobas morio]|uniref:protein takeout-like isoform X2 n=1 Tax=Zophobas morio TaxID=2755281 RepID=UPI0030838D07
MKTFVVTLCLIVFPHTCVKLPPNFIKCNRHEANFQECLIKAVNYDIAQMYKPHKKVRLPGVEPLELLSMSSNVDTNLIKLTERLKNCQFHGVSKGRFRTFVFDFQRRVISANANLPFVESSCDYKLNGTILGVALKGEGPSWLDFTSFNMSFYVTYDEVVKNNKTYVKIATCKVDGKPEKLHFRIDNLFDGDEEAGRRVNEIVNENWSVLYDDIKNEYLDIPGGMLATILKGFFSRVSLEELFD